MTIPTQDLDLYSIDQVNMYFDSLQQDPKPIKFPRYSQHIIRWEWHPWLLLSGYKRRDMKLIDRIDRSSIPCFVVDRQHRYNSENRRVESIVNIYYGKNNFKYKIEPIPIYEEFTFNVRGQLVFIEAWLLRPSEQLMPLLDKDGWPEPRYRLSNVAVPLMDPVSGEIIETAVTNVLSRSDKYLNSLLRRKNAWLESVASQGLRMFVKEQRRKINLRTTTVETLATMVDLNV